MSYTINKINTITITGRDNGPLQVWEVTATDNRGRTHKHRVSTSEFHYRMKRRDWFTNPSSDVQMMAV